MRGIRAIYNKAIEKDDCKPLSNPFTKYKIPRSKNTISIYLRAIRSIYNAAIDEDQFIPIKDSFKVYKIPSRT